MGGYAAIPLAGTPAPRINGYQAAMQGETHGLQVQDDLQQRRLREEQIQSAQLQVEAQRQAAQDQEGLRKAFSAGDIDKFDLLGTKYNISPTAVMKLQQQKAVAVKNLAQSDAATLLADKTRHDEARGQFMAYEGDLADEKKADPANWQGFLTSVKPNMKPEEYAQFVQQFPTYPGRDVMTQHAHGLAFGSQLTKEAMAMRGVVAKEQTADAATTRAQTAQQEADRKANEGAPKIEREQRANAAQALELAAHRGDEDYMRAYHDLPEKFRNEVPTPQEFDAEKTPSLIRTWGSTMAERNRATEADARIAETADWHKAMQKHYAVGEAQGWERIANNKPDGTGQTPNSRAIDMRRAGADFAKAVQQEGPLNDTRRRLGHALEAGSTSFIDKAGKLTTGTTPITDAQRADMGDRLTGATEQLGRLLDQKYAAGEKMGMQPKVSLDEAKAALTSPTKQVPATAAPPPATPATPPKPAAAPAQPQAAAPKQEPFLLKLPNGKFGHFPNRGAAKAWADSQGLTLSGTK